MIQTHYKTNTLWHLHSVLCLHLLKSFWIKDHILRNKRVHPYCRPISVQIWFPQKLHSCHLWAFQQHRYQPVHSFLLSLAHFNLSFVFFWPHHLDFCLTLGSVDASLSPGCTFLDPQFRHPRRHCLCHATHILNLHKNSDHWAWSPPLQTTEHVLQRCPLHKPTREDMRPVSTPLMIKL